MIPPASTREKISLLHPRASGYTTHHVESGKHFSIKTTGFLKPLKDKPHHLCYFKNSVPFPAQTVKCGDFAILTNRNYSKTKSLIPEVVQRPLLSCDQSNRNPTQPGTQLFLKVRKCQRQIYWYKLDCLGSKTGDKEYSRLLVKSPADWSAAGVL